MNNWPHVRRLAGHLVVVWVPRGIPGQAVGGEVAFARDLTDPEQER